MQYLPITGNLYKERIPGNKSHAPAERVEENGRIAGVTVPTLTAYLPSEKDELRPAVIICPGGGYHRVAMEHEGHEVARAFYHYGVAAFVLKYRIPSSFTEPRSLIPLMDLQRSIRICRQDARGWDIDPQRIGVLGFSAGGHLASTAGTRFDAVDPQCKSKINLRPDFMILGYPVISLTDGITHGPSRENLLGKDASPEMVKLLSNELHVSAQTPPTFIFHAANDPHVPVANSIRFFEALREHGVFSEMHIYQGGGHGFGLHNKTTGEDWFVTMLHWMRSNNFLKGNRLS